MEIKEIDGKKFIEYDEHKRQRKRMIISVLFLIIITLAIVALANATITLVKNKDIIQSDPLRYGMEVHGFVSCQCFDDEGQDWYSEGSGFINVQRPDNWINYSEINITKFKGVLNGDAGNS